MLVPGGSRMTGVPNAPGGGPESAEHHGTRSEMSGSAGNVVQGRDISGGVHFHSSSVSAGPRPAELPGEARGFVNRVRELQRLDAATREFADTEASRLRLALIVGCPGPRTAWWSSPVAPACRDWWHGKGRFV
jgi:hypothetical protein